MECSICLESLLDSGSKRCSATRCGHIFHQKCLLDWLKTDSSCPKCRKPVLTRQLRQLYPDGSDNASKVKKSLKQEGSRPKLQSLGENLKHETKKCPKEKVRIRKQKRSNSNSDNGISISVRTDFRRTGRRISRIPWKILKISCMICGVGLLIWGMVSLISWMSDGPNAFEDAMDALGDGLDVLGDGLDAFGERLEDWINQLE